MFAVAGCLGSLLLSWALHVSVKNVVCNRIENVVCNRIETRFMSRKVWRSLFSVVWSGDLLQKVHGIGTAFWVTGILAIVLHVLLRQTWMNASSTPTIVMAMHHAWTELDLICAAATLATVEMGHHVMVSFSVDNAEYLTQQAAILAKRSRLECTKVESKLRVHLTLYGCCFCIMQLA